MIIGNSATLNYGEFMITPAYALQGREAAFKSEIGQFMAAYSRRKALIERLEKAGIWGER